MNKKIIPITIAALLGAGVGAFLSYGPLKQYKSEAVLNIDMDTAEYKRFTELASNANLKQYVASTKQKDVTVEVLEAHIKDNKRADWYKPVLKFSKTDNKDAPDWVVRLELENYRKREQVLQYENEKLFGKELNTIRNDYPAYVGLQIFAYAPEPQLAADKAKWLSEYAQNIAAMGALYTLITKWENENKFFAERIQAKKIQNEFETEQLKTKSASLKKSIENYPTTVQKEVNREIEVGREQTKAMTPAAQMLSIELELLDIEIKNQKLNRANEQITILADILKQVVGIKSDVTGLNRLAMLDEILNSALNKTELLSNKEKLLMMQNEVSNIKFKLVKKPQYIALPNVPLQQAGPAPIKLIILMSILSAAFMVLFLWRAYILKLINQDDAKVITHN